MTRCIPNLYHFVFGLKPQLQPFHLLHYLCLESCRQVNKPDKIYFHYFQEPWGKYWRRIKPYLTLVHVEKDNFVDAFKYRDSYMGKFRYAHHSDFIRLRQLKRYGGVYADIDTLFIQPYPNRLFHHSFVLGREGDIRDEVSGQSRASLCNAVIMSEPDSAFGNLWLERKQAAFNGTWSNHSTLLPQELSEAHPEWISVEPSRSFYRYMWTPEHFRALFEEHEDDWENTYSLHLWSHLWWSRRRKDFSRMHAGFFNEKYIRTVDSTFNCVARRFLS